MLPIHSSWKELFFIPAFPRDEKREENSHSLLESAISKARYWDKKMQQNNNFTKVKIFKCLSTMEPLISLQMEEIDLN